MKELIHFAHGNGFPSLSYRQLLLYLGQRYECIYIPKVGHDKAFPVTENWPFLVKELTKSIETQAKGRAVIAVGHSMGGVLSFLAAIEAPHLFKALVLLDSPLLGPIKSHLLNIAKTMGIIDRITPAYRTKHRKEYWEDKTQLLAYLRKKNLFKSFDEKALHDYVDYGLDKTDEGYALAFDRQIEYLIYRTLPHTLFQYEGQLKVPSALIYGNKSSIIHSFDRFYMKKAFNITSFKMRGSHMFPLEHPKETGEKIFEVLDFLKKGP